MVGREEFVNLCMLFSFPGMPCLLPFFTYQVLKYCSDTTFSPEPGFNCTQAADAKAHVFDNERGGRGRPNNEKQERGDMIQGAGQSHIMHISKQGLIY